MTATSYIKQSLRCATAIAAIGVGFSVAQTDDPKESGSARVNIMSFEDYAKKRHRVPYIVKSRAGKGRLVYFGARHTFDPTDPELKQIEKEWVKLRPDVAFFEGADPGVTPAKVTSRDEIARSGEPSFVLFLATRDSVPVKTLEPAQGDEIALLLAKYAPEEIKVFYILRQIPEFNSGKHDESVDTYTKGVLAWLSSKPELRGGPHTIAELEVISGRLFPQLADWRAVPKEWFDPTQTSTYLNDMSRRLSEFRDRHMVRLLTEQIALGKRVFAVVGASHVVMQEGALRAAFIRKR